MGRSVAQTGADAQQVARIDLSGFAASRIVRDLPISRPATADIEAHQRHIGGRPEWSLSAPVASPAIDRFS